MKGRSIAAMLLALTLLAGCGTSNLSSVEEESIPEAGSWQELTLPGISPSPSAGTVMPELSVGSNLESGTDVTADYKTAFIGIWDGENTGFVYEFKGNENLDVYYGGEKQSYTYWFMDTGKQVRLCIYANGADAEVTYSFTRKGDNITLYDISTGDAVELMVRRPPATPTPTKRSSSSGTTTTTTTKKPSASKAPAASPSPSVAPSPSPSAEPSPSPSPSPSVEPSPSPSVEPSPSPSPEVQVSETVKAVLPKVECVLDVVIGGGSFSSSDANSFWSIMARYASQKGYTTEDGYAVLTPEEMLSCAGQVFAGIGSLPACPEGSSLVIHDPADEENGTPERYRLQLGNMGGLDMTVVSCDSDSVFQVEVRSNNNALLYEVTLSGGAISSIVER